MKHSLRSAGIVLVVALVLVALLVWSLARNTSIDADVTPRPSPNEPPATAAAQERVVVDAPSALDARDAPIRAAAEVNAEGVEAGLHSAGTRVRSSADIPLRHVEVRELVVDAVGGWSRIHRAEDARELFVVIDAPSEVRSPGHVTAQLEVGVEELLLEPDALLELFAPDLEGRVEAIEAEFRERFMSFGFVDADTWRFAVSTDAPQAVLRGGVHVRSFGEAFRVELEHVPPGMRARYELPLAWLGDVADLEVHVEPASDQDTASSLRLSVQLFDRTGPRKVATYSWGTVFHYGQAARTETFHERRFALMDVALGREYSLRVRDEETGDIASVERLHDGTPWEIALTGGFVLRAHLVDEDGAARTTSVSARWSWLPDGNATPSPQVSITWTSKATKSETMDGRLELVLSPGLLLDHIPTRPERLHLQLLAPGCEDLLIERNVPLGERELDLGTLVLASRTPELSLAADPTIQPANVGFIAFSGDVHGFYSVELVRESDGALDVFLVPWAREDHREATGDVRVTCERILVLPPDTQQAKAVAFERGEDSLYRAIAMRQHALRARVASDIDGPIWLGWSWNGLDHTVAQAKPGEEVELEFNAPVSATLTWRTKDDAQGGEQDTPADLRLWLIP